jgi:hypothetical protein
MRDPADDRDVQKVQQGRTHGVLLREERDVLTPGERGGAVSSPRFAAFAVYLAFQGVT